MWQMGSLCNARSLHTRHSESMCNKSVFLTWTQHKIDKLSSRHCHHCTDAGRICVPMRRLSFPTMMLPQVGVCFTLMRGACALAGRGACPRKTAWLWLVPQHTFHAGIILEAQPYHILHTTASSAQPAQLRQHYSPRGLSIISLIITRLEVLLLSLLLLLASSSWRFSHWLSFA